MTDKEVENFIQEAEEILEFNYRKPRKKRTGFYAGSAAGDSYTRFDESIGCWQGDDQLRQAWLKEQDERRKEGELLWGATGLPEDVRKGYEKAKKEGKLYSCGIFDVSLEIVESIEEAREHTLELAGVAYHDKVSMLKQELEEKEEVIETLLETIAELRSTGRRSKRRGATSVDRRFA